MIDSHVLERRLGAVVAVVALQAAVAAERKERVLRRSPKELQEEPELGVAHLH